MKQCIKSKVTIQRLEQFKFKMASLPRQKSTKNIHLHEQNRSTHVQSKRVPFQNQFQKLKLQELKTQLTINSFSIPLCKLAQKYNPSQKLKQAYSQKIFDMQTRYYDSGMINLDYEIEFNQQGEFLKRYYYEWENQQKITVLGEYYKYHTDQPRIFLKDQHQIVAAYQQQVRELQYNYVRLRIQQERQANEEIDKQEVQPVIKNIDSKNNLNSIKDKDKKTQVILKNNFIFSDDFLNKLNKQPKQKEIHKKSSQPFTLKEKPLFKSNSLNYKRLIPSNSEHRAGKEKEKNGNKVFCLKNVQHKQFKNLQSKYTQVISQLFKKKRSSSKNIVMLKKVENRPNDLSHKEKCEKDHLLDSKRQQNVIESQNAIQLKKIARSKSQNNMNICKSNKLLKTLKSKIPQKVINLKVNHSSRQSIKQKKQYMTGDKSSNKQKFSSNQSLKRKNAIQKAVKTVKVFEITKKDLAVEPDSKYSSVQKDLGARLNLQKLDKDKPKQRKEGKQNNTNQAVLVNEKKRIYQQKVNSQFNSVGKKPNENTQKTDRQPTNTVMFGRVLRSKIRG